MAQYGTAELHFVHGILGVYRPEDYWSESYHRRFLVINVLLSPNSNA